MLGYKLLENQGDSMFKHYILTKENYLLKSEKLRRIAEKLNGKKTKIVFETADKKLNFLWEKLDEESIKRMNLDIEKACL